MTPEQRHGATTTMKEISSSETIFNNAKRIAEVIAKTFGKNCEVAVHDFKDLEHSLIHLSGTLTKRKVGAPVTDLVVKAWRAEGNDAKDIINYRTQTKDGRILKSSTVFLRDDSGTIIGALCTNFDTTDFSNAISLIESLIENHDTNRENREETFASSVVETNEALLDHAVKTVGKHPTTMNKEEKLQCLSILENSGAFLIKGMVDFVAEGMSISKYTVYSYLKQIRSNK